MYDLFENSCLQVQRVALLHAVVRFEKILQFFNLGGVRKVSPKKLVRKVSPVDANGHFIVQYIIYKYSYIRYIKCCFITQYKLPTITFQILII